MRRALLVLGAALCTAHVYAGTWDLHYGGMPWAGGGDGASATMDLTFVGIDSNHDGVLTATELTKLSFTLAIDGSGFSTDYPVLPVASLVPCGPHPACQSTLDDFAFNTQTRTLSRISASGLAAFDDFLSFDGTTVDVYGRAFWDATLGTLTVSDQSGPPSPVPEPSTVVMIAAGIVVFGRQLARKAAA